MYTDTLPGIAYSVLKFSSSTLTSMPQVKAVFKGLKLYDPRTGVTAWSDNAGLALRACLSDAWGEGKPITGGDSDVANWCDTVVGSGASAEARCRIGITLNTRQLAEQWRATLATYAECFIVPDGDGYLLIPDAPADPEYAFDHNSTTLAGSLLTLGTINRAGMNNQPTVVTVWYTDRSVFPWASVSADPVKRPEVIAGTLPWRPQEIRMAGIFSKSQAMRLATTRLNKLWLCDLSGEIHGLDDSMQIRPGTVVTLTDPRGLVAKQVRVFSMSGINGQYTLPFNGHDNDAYDYTVVADDVRPDTPLPLPNSPPTVTGLVASEEIFQQQDGTWSSRIRATCDASQYLFLANYRFEAWADGQLIDSKMVATPVYVTPAVQELVTYTIRAWCVSVVGASSATPAEATLLAEGKFLPPSDVSSLSGFEVGGEVRLTLGAAIDKDLKCFEVRYGPAATAPNLWVNATFLNTTPAASGVGGFISSKQVPAGAWEFLACALDSVGNYSINPARRTITVTLDVSSFLVSNISLVNPTTINMTAYQLGRTDGKSRWATDDGIPFGTKFPAAVGSYPSLVQDALPSQWLSETYDFGLLLAGNWAGDTNEDENPLAGALAEYLELATKSATVTISNGSPAVVSWTGHGLPVGQSVMFTTSGALPAPLSVDIPYYLIAAGYGANAFEVSATPGGAAINTTTAGSGAHTAMDWTQYPATVAKTSARYGRYRVEALAGNAFSMYLPTVNIRIDAIPREENGSTVSVASGPKTITLANAYTAVQNISIVPIGTTSLTFAVDNIVVGATTSFDVYIFNGSNAQVANAFNWNFKGV